MENLRSHPAVDTGRAATTVDLHLRGAAHMACVVEYYSR